MKAVSVLKLVGAIVICELAGMIGSIFTFPSVTTWYATLTKPALNPPSWIFGPVWTTLFLLMGIAVFLVWQKGWQKKEVKRAVIFFVIQLFLNVVWSIIFFGLHSPFWAFMDIILLWLAILFTLISFFKISKAAGWLLVPYIIWVSFAAYLNLTIVLVNR